MLAPHADRHTLFPIKYDDVYAMYLKQKASFWDVAEIDLQSDRKDWLLLNDNERHFIKHVLAFFAASDGIVQENLALRFSNDVQVAEVRLFYAFQNAMEGIHSETYSLLIDAYVQDPEERLSLFRAVETMPAITRKAAWAQKWIESDRPFAHRLVAFAVVEGIFFSGSFCAIYWIKSKGLMQGLTFSNELISRDEAMHCEFATLLHSKLDSKCEAETAREIVTEAVDIEHDFVTDALPVTLLGMNAASMRQYICYVADFWMVRLGFEKIYDVPNPFDFMELISLEGKTNFFERRVGEYKRATMDHQFALDEDF
jgi:ribonucleoside-diphosphate reductase beta chain